MLLLFYHFHSLSVLISNSLRLKVENILLSGMTDVIVNDRWRRAEKLGIEFEVEFYPVDGISVFDLGMILGNLLDNAIEACEKDRQETADFGGIRVMKK